MANTTEPSVCGGDAALCQITLTTCSHWPHTMTTFLISVSTNMAYSSYSNRDVSALMWPLSTVTGHLHCKCGTVCLNTFLHILNTSLQSKRVSSTFSHAGIWYKCSAAAEMGDHLATIDMGQKLGGLCPFCGKGELGTQYPCNTMWPGLTPISAPTGILIHRAVWAQQMGQN